MERLLTVRPHYFILRDREQSSGTIAAGQTDWEGWYTVFPSTLGLIKNHVLSWASAAVCMRGASGRVIDPPECLKSLQCHPSGPLSLTHNRQTYQHVGGRGGVGGVWRCSLCLSVQVSRLILLTHALFFSLFLVLLCEMDRKSAFRCVFLIFSPPQASGSLIQIISLLFWIMIHLKSPLWCHSRWLWHNYFCFIPICNNKKV